MKAWTVVSFNSGLALSVRHLNNASLAQKY